MKKSKGLLKTTITAVGILHCINKVIDSTSITATSTKTSGKYYHWKHGDIFYKVSGQGTPLLLIHDLNVFSSCYEWSQLIDKLSEYHTVYALDLIGCGKSDKPAITYTNYFYVQMVSDFITDIIGEKTDVAATGFSSSFVLMANAMNKNLINKMVMINPNSISSLKVSPDDRSKILLKLFELPVIGKSVYYIATNKTFVEDYLAEKCFYNPFNLKPSITKAYYDAAHAANGNGKSLFASIEGNYVNADITNSLKSAANEIILVNGIHREKAGEVANSYLRINSAICVETIDNCSYLPHFEAVDDLFEILK